MEHTLPGILNTNVKIEKFNVKTGELVDVYHQHNRLVIRYHLIMTHLLSPVGNVLLQSEMNESDFAKYGIPTDSDLKITKMRFGTDGTPTAVTMDNILSPVLPKFNADGIAITDDYYPIDGYKFINGIDVNDVKDYDQAISFETTIAGPQGNSETVQPVVYKEAGLFTTNNIMMARTNLPSLVKDENFAFKMSWTIRFP